MKKKLTGKLRLPVPPPGCDHETVKKTERKRERDRLRREIEEELETYYDPRREI